MGVGNAGLLESAKYPVVGICCYVATLGGLAVFLAVCLGGNCEFTKVAKVIVVAVVAGNLSDECAF